MPGKYVEGDDVENLPVTKSQLEALIKSVAQQLAGPVDIECDHTLRYTIAFLDERLIEKEPVLSWLGKIGASCDCKLIHKYTAPMLGTSVGRPLTDGGGETA